MRLRLNPYGRLCLSVGSLVLIGWVALMMPGMTARTPITWYDALFTSASAACVTGLVVRSTQYDWSLSGQMIILILIQVGGLGFMTLSSSLLMRLRRSATLDQIEIIHKSLGNVVSYDLNVLLWRCLKIVATIEGIGAALLFVRFIQIVPPESSWFRHVPEAAWQAVFHSVSAFCNAGFSIWNDNLRHFVADPWVNFVIMALIISGGLGFFVLADLQAWVAMRAHGRKRNLRYQTIVVLTTTVTLISLGALFIWLAERKNGLTLAGRPVLGQWMPALFHSVTARTAGFNTIGLTRFTNFSLGILIILMFIGASPGSCGGGVKTTTYAVLVTLAVGAFRAGREPSFRNRSFAPETVRSAVALLFSALGFVTAGALFMMFVEHGNQALEVGKGNFLGNLFEAVSAFGTVGLSTGITPSLSLAGKLCLIVLMFLGRVGPLGLISASLRGGVRHEIQYPYESIQIG